MADVATQRSARTPVGPSETPRERFVRLAELRTANVLDSLGRLAPLANKSQYEYSEDDVAKVTEAIQSKLAEVARTLRSGRVGRASGFSLSDK